MNEINHERNRRLGEIIETIKKLNLERVGIMSRIDEISTQLRDIRSGQVPPIFLDEAISKLLEQMEEAISRLNQNKTARLALKEKFDELPDRE